MGWFILGTFFGVILMCCVVAAQRADEQMQLEVKKELQRKKREEKAKQDEKNKKGN